jgi:hypothetical protein
MADPIVSLNHLRQHAQKSLAILIILINRFASVTSASTLIKTDPVMLKIIDPPDAQIYENGKVREGQERLLVGWIVRREVRWFKST